MSNIKRNGVDLTSPQIAAIQTDLSLPANTVAALAGKADSGHTHTATAISDSTVAGRAMVTAADSAAQTQLLGTFTYTQKGLVPAPTGSGTTRFLREDGSWQAVSAGAASWGGITGTLSAQTDLSAALAAKSDILNTATETGVAWTLTKAAHSQRQVIATNAAAITVTVNTAGMDVNDYGRIIHGGAGQVSFTGVTPVYAGGVTNTATIPVGTRNWVDWRYDGTNFVIDQKSEDATGGGGGTVVQDLAIKAATGAADVDETLATLSIPARAAGDRTRIIAFFNIGNGGVNNVDFKIVWGAEIVDLWQFATPSQNMTVAVDFTVLHRSTTEHITKPWTARLNERVNGSSGVLTMNTSAATNLSFVVQRKVDTNRTAQLLGCRAEF